MGPDSAGVVEVTERVSAAAGLVASTMAIVAASTGGAAARLVNVAAFTVVVAASTMVVAASTATVVAATSIVNGGLLGPWAVGRALSRRVGRVGAPRAIPFGGGGVQGMRMRSASSPPGPRTMTVRPSSEMERRVS